jgi:hypothetical protein
VDPQRLTAAVLLAQELVQRPHELVPVSGFPSGRCVRIGALEQIGHDVELELSEK